MIFLALPLAAVLAVAPSLPRTSYVFKKVGDLEISVDVHRAEGTDVLPVVVWIHGGALIMGSRRDWVPQVILDLCRTKNCAIVSLDYRLAPQAKISQIIEDIKDAFVWIGGQGAQIAHLDPKRMVVAGGSAGGYLTLMSGVVAKPKPLALVAYWGYGDVDGDWYTQASVHYRETKPLYLREPVLKDLAPGVVAGPADKAQAEAREHYYLYLRQNGLWTKEVTGFTPGKDRKKLDRYCPVRNVTPSYPPTLLVHGTEDQDVPYDRSVLMAKELERKKVKHELLSVPGGGHGLGGADPKVRSAAHARVAEFIREHLGL